MKHFTIQILLFLIILITAIECQRWGSRNLNNSGKQNSRSSAYHADNGSNSKSTEAPAKSQERKQSSRAGIGAWGYVAIALTIILSGLGAYYFVIFYPIVCKKERMYDVMEMTTV